MSVKQNGKRRRRSNRQTASTRNEPKIHMKPSIGTPPPQVVLKYLLPLFLKKYGEEIDGGE